MGSNTTTRPYNAQWDDPTTHDGQYPPDWTARCHQAFEHTNYTCENCGWTDPVYTDGAPETPDRELRGKHIQPPSENGGNEIENIATVCTKCYPDTAQTNVDSQQAATNKSTPPPQSKNALAKVDIFAPPGGSPEQYTAYQMILRMALMLSVIGIAVVLVYQIIVQVYTTLNAVTLTYPFIVYPTLLVVAGVVAEAVRTFGEEVTLSDSSPAEVYKRPMMIAIALMAVAILSHHTLGREVLPGLGTPGQMYATLAYMVIVGIYATGAVLSISVGLIGMMDLRYKLDAPVMPSVWTMALLAPALVLVWTWAIAGTPFLAADSITYVLPVVGEVTRANVIDTLLFVLPVVAVSYLVRVTLALKQLR